MLEKTIAGLAARFMFGLSRSRELVLTQKIDTREDALPILPLQPDPDLRRMNEMLADGEANFFDSRYAGVNFRLDEAAEHDRRRGSF